MPVSGASPQASATRNRRKAGSPARTADDPNGPGEATPGQPQSTVVIPEIYGLAARTPLIIEVSQDQHTYELKLTWGRRR